MAFSIGIGLTNECDLRCPHCYRPDATVDRLSLSTVRRVLDALPVGSMNLGVGENGLHPEYRAVLDFLAERRIKTSITSNGTSIAALGVPLGITAVLMRINTGSLSGLVEVARRNGTYLRVNVYQPAKVDAFTLTYEAFWAAFRELAGVSRLVATTEPVLAGVLGLAEFAGPGCARTTVRVAPDGRILPCTYWPRSALGVQSLEALGEAILETAEFRDARQVPERCAGCPCRGGCAGRRALLAALGEPDPYCPFARGATVRLDWPRATGGDLPKVGSACTTVVVPA